MPVQYTACEKLTVTVFDPTAPVAELIVGAVLGTLVADAVWPCGALIVLPVTSRMCWFCPAAPLSRRSTSTNAPGGIGVVRKRFAVVTALLAVASQTGVLSPVRTSVVFAETLLTCQSVARNAVVRQTGSLYVTVTTLPGTDIPVKVGRVRW